MTGPRRWAAGLLTAALLLALATPAYLAYSEQSVAGYLLHPSLFLLQALPYAVGAALWIPAWTWGSEIASLILSFFLFTASLVLYLPVLWAPGEWGGDMIGLAFVAISLATTGIVVAASGLIALDFRLRRRGASDSIGRIP